LPSGSDAGVGQWLAECFAALALGFVTLAVPLALDARWTIRRLGRRGRRGVLDGASARAVGWRAWRGWHCKRVGGT
jgi:3-methyladenine DNA glycosylase/8-oxoguanine DNA glycosylase